VFASDLPGVNPATLNEMLLYYRLMTKRSGLGDSTELSRMGLSQLDSEATAHRCPGQGRWAKGMTGGPHGSAAQGVEGERLRPWADLGRKATRLAR
jgi:hypothetical protein